MTKSTKESLFPQNAIAKFLCPGCVSGGASGPEDCPQFRLEKREGGASCTGHVSGTFAFGAGHIALGMPKGFNRARVYDTNTRAVESASRFNVTFFPRSVEVPESAPLNMHTWGREYEGYLFLRVFSPRTNLGRIEVYEGKTLADDAPEALDVSKFEDTFD